MPTLNTGIAAPDFKLPNIQGSPFSLRDTLKHGPVVLAFFKVSCPVCQFTFPYLERLYQSVKGKNITIVGISQNNQQDTNSFMKQFGVTFPVLLDDPKGYPVSNAYGITNVPTLFYIAEDGSIEVSSVGWSREDLQQISRLAGEKCAIGKLNIIKPGENVPAFKAG
ncbi:MAG TPA: TlpA disulfide reductase family protein [Terriglobales bacterium]|jgi:peroxiredoxin|nr:TlpA disulfide reductase family protein [Terriglobales bacterium]